MISLIGAFIYRWRGSDGNPHPLPEIIFALPYGLITLFYWLNPLGYWAIIPALVVWILSTLGVLTGHGRGIDMGDTDIGEPERLEFLIAWLKPHVPLYWYDMALLSITGLAVTLPAGIATLNPILAVSGLLKGPCYGVGKYGCPDRHTEAGELLTGAVLWGMLVLCVSLMILEV